MDKRYYLVSNIEWDTDGKKVAGLPNEMGLTLEPEDYDGLEPEEIEENIIDFLSDRYEWCIADYDIEEVTI